MINPITELFLTQYYLMDTLFDKHFINKKNWFKSIGKAFGISTKELDTLFEQTEHPAVKSIATEKEYFRHLRIKQYISLTSTENEFSDSIDEVITIKGAVLTLSVNYGFKKAVENTPTSICNDLIQKVHEGNITAMRLYAMSHLEFGEDSSIKKHDESIRMLEAASSWMDIPSAVILRHYDPDNIFASEEHLFAASYATPYNELVKNIYKISKEDKILTKAFISNILEPETFVHQYAKILFNKNIPINEREKIVLYSGKDAVCTAARLPLNINHKRTPIFDYAPLDSILNERTSEKIQIKRNLYNADLRMHDGYKPLCISCDSSLVLKMYSDAIFRASKNSNTVNINISEYSEKELEMTGENIFVTNCKENSPNIFLITCTGKLSEKASECIKTFLNARQSFRLIHPCITLDLSAVLPIFFCDRQNAKLFKSFCEVINVTSMNENELSKAITGFLSVYEKKYGISKIRIDDSLLAKLVRFEFSKVKTILDRAIMSMRIDNKEINLTSDSVDKFIQIQNDTNSYSYGFGGIE